MDKNLSKKRRMAIALVALIFIIFEVLQLSGVFKLGHAVLAIVDMVFVAAFLGIAISVKKYNPRQIKRKS